MSVLDDLEEVKKILNSITDTLSPSDAVVASVVSALETAGYTVTAPTPNVPTESDSNVPLDTQEQ